MKSISALLRTGIAAGILATLSGCDGCTSMCTISAWDGKPSAACTAKDLMKQEYSFDVVLKERTFNHARCPGGVCRTWSSTFAVDHGLYKIKAIRHPDIGSWLGMVDRNIQQHRIQPGGVMTDRTKLDAVFVPRTAAECGGQLCGQLDAVPCDIQPDGTCIEGGDYNGQPVVITVTFQPK